MKLPRFTLKRGMLLVALAALAVWLPIEIKRLRKLSEGYTIQAARAGAWERRARKDAARSKEEWASIVEKFDREERDRGGWYKTGRPHSPEKAPRVIRYYETLRLKYERLSRYPWLPVGTNPPFPE